jgi:hypothetical protein
MSVGLMTTAVVLSTTFGAGFFLVKKGFGKQEFIHQISSSYDNRSVNQNLL